MIRRRKALVLALAVVLPLAAACDDPFAPEPTPVPGPKESTLYDFRTGPLTEPSAFDVFSNFAVRTDQTSSWDFLFFVTEAGEARFHPRGFALGQSSSAGFQAADGSFEGLLEVPGEGYTTDAAIPLSDGAVYAVRSRRSGGCTHYAKLRVDSLQVAGGRVFVTTVANPNCNRRSVEPQENDES